MEEYQVIFTKPADRLLKRLPEKVQRRITARIDALANEPRPPDVAKLAGFEDLWRIRVGDYRVIYTIQDEELIVLVVRVAHRKDVYRGL